MTSPLGVESELVRQVAQQVSDAGDELDGAQSRLDKEITTSEGSFGEYGAGQQFNTFRSAWLTETKITRKALAETRNALTAAADRYDETDETAALRVAEPAQQRGA